VPNANYLAGRRLEYLTIKRLRAMGYDAQRSAGSKSAFDIVAWSTTRCLHVQCKRGRIAKPANLLAELLPQLPEGCTAAIAIQEKGQPLEFYTGGVPLL
jgi:Holliday junction resolvase